MTCKRVWNRGEMRVTFLGTSAGEEYPGFWCECKKCSYARAHGGRNVRGNSSVLIDHDLLIDINAHSFKMFQALQISPQSIRHLLVTHPHIDHFDAQKFTQRRVSAAFFSMSDELLRQHVSPCFSDLPILHIYGNEAVCNALENSVGSAASFSDMRIAFHQVHAGKKENCSGFSFIPVRSQHGPCEGFARNSPQFSLFNIDGIILH